MSKDDLSCFFMTNRVRQQMSPHINPSLWYWLARVVANSRLIASRSEICQNSALLRGIKRWPIMTSIAYKTYSGSRERFNGSANQDYAVTVTTKSMFGRGIRKGGCIM